ncbi:PLDc N-terminal domain-containing protein [Candidatus Woesearchaeota archaeon]|nr:PLDc N-terminal domain-containing protein [Candidatus Woesearchaeota archaeon]
MFQTILWILSVAAFLYVLIDILQNQKKMNQNHKIIWIICALIFNIITAVVYYFVVKKK